MAERAKPKGSGTRASGTKGSAKSRSSTKASSTKASSTRARSTRAEPTASKPAKAKRTEKAEERKPKLPKLKDVRHWVGLRVDGIGNRTLGRVAGLHVDAEDGEPRWVVIRLGPIAGCTAIPFEHVAEGAGRLWAAYAREWVREAPRFRPSEALTADNELELCAHWGIREKQGRSAELKKTDGDEISAVPAGV